MVTVAASHALVAAACDGPGGGGGRFDGIALDASADLDTSDAAGQDASPPDTACVDVCEAGAVRCDNDGVVTCAVDPATGCLAFGGHQPCEAGQTCSNGVCSTECSDECLPAGIALCEGNGFKTCGQYDSDACLDWSSLAPCGSTESCVNGACVASCQDECSPAGTAGCDGDGTRTCGEYDSDACLEWGPTTPCASGQSCSSGVCSSSCSDECDSAGEPGCVAGGVATCGQHDGDACLEWGPATACPDGQTCDAGVCQGGGCDATCTTGTATCSGPNGFVYCGVSAGCPVESNFVSCKPGNECTAGSCGGSCVQAPELLLVVDRSSSMQGAVWEYTEARITDLAEDVQAQVALGARSFPGDVDGCTPGAVVSPSLDNAAGVQSVLVEPASAASTPLAAALDGLIPAFGDPNQGEHVVLITDGSETCGTTDDLLANVQKLRNRATHVHVVAVGSGFDTLLLQQIAATGDGLYLEAATGPELRDVLRQIVAEATGCGAIADGVQTCDGGSCAATACDAGFHACDAQCEADDDVTACGAACQVCPGDTHGAPVCDGGSCTLDCDPGFHLCGGACVADDSLQACGAQCVTCVQPSGGSVACVGGACQQSCPSGSTLFQDACVQPGALVAINELMADPSFETSWDEWIEVVNLADVAVDLSGVQVASGPSEAEQDVKATFPDGTIVPAREAVIVLGGTAEVPPKILTTPYVVGSKSLSLNNSGDTVTLLSPDGEILDQLTYPSQSNGISWARVPDGIGAFQQHPQTTAVGAEYGGSWGLCVSGEPLPSCLP